MRERERGGGGGGGERRQRWFLFLLLSNSMLCIITAFNIELLHTEHRDFQMRFCQMGSDGKPKREFLPLR